MSIKKQKCIVCQDELISDTEEEQLKNIGCDHCYRWYHLKCTKKSNIPYVLNVPRTVHTYN